MSVWKFFFFGFFLAHTLCLPIISIVHDDLLILFNATPKKSSTVESEISCFLASASLPDENFGKLFVIFEKKDPSENCMIRSEIHFR